MRKSAFTFTFFALTLVLSAAPAKDPLLMKDPDWVDDRFNAVDHGAFMHYSFALPKRKVPKGIAIKVGDEQSATICFDTLLCSYAGAWTNGFLELSSKRFGFAGDAKPPGNIQWTTPLRAGWSILGNFLDPRPRVTAPLPPEHARYEGLYRNGKRTVLNCQIHGVDVLDHPWFESRDGINAFTRTLEIAPTDTELQFLVTSMAKSKVSEFHQHGIRGLQLESGKDLIAVSLKGDAAELIAVGNDQIAVRVPAHDKTLRIKVLIWRGDRKRLPAYAAFVKVSPEPAPLAILRESGFSRLWLKPITTRGRVGLPLGPFAIDTITLPFKNPYQALFFAGGHDFLPSGDALLCTTHGDVWLVKGIDKNLRNISWTRFATGLYQPLGLKVIGEKIYVLGKDQITELRDINNDGEADHYRNFCNLSEITGGGHNYATCLETDPQGNFWFIRCNDKTPHGGTLLKVRPDGRAIEVVATGFRNPNGMGVSPDGLVTAADQQGKWVPETRLDICEPGGFYGYVPMSKREEEPNSFDGPLCWIPRILDNSAGAQTWVPKGNWGPLSEKMIHISYGRCTIMTILRDTATKGANGGIVPLPGRFEAGVMRGRFHSDGHLYLSGLKGWQTVGLADGAFQRVRYTGRRLFLPIAFGVHANGLKLTFNEKLRRDLAEDLGSYDAEMWNYLWTENYGSDDYSVLDPETKGRDPLTIKSARLLEDEKSVFLEIPGLHPAHQVALQYNLTTTKGLKKKDTFHFTINKIGQPF